jgi:hypothetical protein
MIIEEATPTNILDFKDKQTITYSHGTFRLLSNFRQGGQRRYPAMVAIGAKDMLRRSSGPF